ncbi:MAG: apolipoprotein N-acyltransferase [Rhodobacteraceae bacterium]|nr:apolipoprotein N-acyltransferase [Paracoccaceae bacterium]
MPGVARVLDRLQGQGAACALAAGAGLAAGLGHPPYSLPALFLLGLGVGALLLCTRQGWVHAGTLGLCFGAGHFGLTLSWLVEPFLVFRDSVWLAPIVAGLMIVGMSLFWMIAFALAWIVGASRLEKCLALALFLTLSGMLREHAFSGFPWALPAYVWSESPIAQVASATGSHGLTLLTALVAVLPVAFGRSARGWTLALALLATMAGLGQIRQSTQLVLPRDQPVVRLVQPNIPQHLKWSPEHAAEFLQRMYRLSVQPGDRSLSQIIWPETAITFEAYKHEEVTQFKWLSDAVGNIPMIVGIPSWRGDRPFNSMLFIDSSGKVSDVYDKRHLVPFGEYVPFYGLLARFGISAVARVERFGFTAGADDGHVYVGPLGRMTPVICYEMVFPREVRMRPRPDVIVQITNDAWFGEFSGPQQHFAQSRMRSIELGLPLLRVANTGISAATDAHGRVLSSLDVGEQGFLDVSVPPPLPPTIYARFGELPALLLLAASAALLVRRRLVHRV